MISLNKILKYTQGDIELVKRRSFFKEKNRNLLKNLNFFWKLKMNYDVKQNYKKLSFFFFSE